MLEHMKKLSVLLILTGLGLPGRAAAQSITMGPKVGVGLATFGGGAQWPGPFRARASVSIGAATELPVSRVFAFQLEALLALRGAEGQGVRMNLLYLETPLLVRATLPGSTQRLRPTLLVGLAPAWEVSCNAEQQVVILTAPASSEWGGAGCETWRTERHDVGVVLGGGFEGPVGRVRITAEFRLTMGTVNLGDGVSSQPAWVIRNRLWSLMLGTVTSL